MKTALSFPHDDKKYICERCCCGTVHCLTGTLRIAILMSIWSCIALLSIMASGSISLGLLAVILIDITTVAFLFLGIRQMNPRFILPYVIWSFLNMVFKFLVVPLALIFSFSVTVFLDGSFLAGTVGKECSEIDEENPMDKACNVVNMLYLVPILFFIFLAIVSCLSLILNYWFYNVTKRCYIYLKDFEEHRKIYGSVAVEVQGLSLP